MKNNTPINIQVTHLDKLRGFSAVSYQKPILLNLLTGEGSLEQQKTFFNNI